MLSSISSFFNYFLSEKKYTPLISLSKKDDDLSQEKVNAWRLKYPVKNEIADWKTEKIHEFVQQLFRDLPPFEICQENFSEVKSHLIQLANSCGRARRITIEAWRKVLCASEIKVEIALSLALSTPNRV